MESIKKYIKDNWLLLLVIGCVLFLVWGQYTSNDLYEKLFNDYQAQKEAFERQISQLEEINRNHVEERQKMRSHYDSELKRIETDYHLSLKNLEKQTEKSKAALIKEAEINPDSLLEKIAKEFGIAKFTGDIKTCQ